MTAEQFMEKWLPDHVPCSFAYLDLRTVIETEATEKLKQDIFQNVVRKQVARHIKAMKKKNKI